VIIRRAATLYRLLLRWHYCWPASSQMANALSVLSESRRMVDAKPREQLGEQARTIVHWLDDRLSSTAIPGWAISSSTAKSSSPRTRTKPYSSSTPPQEAKVTKSSNCSPSSELRDLAPSSRSPSCWHHEELERPTAETRVQTGSLLLSAWLIGGDPVEPLPECVPLAVGEHVQFAELDP
jgi:hypothetical protein